MYWATDYSHLETILTTQAATEQKLLDNKNGGKTTVSIFQVKTSED